MNEIPTILKKFWVQIIYFLVVPSFFMAFVLLYEPFGLVQYFDMGSGLFAMNLSILTAISFVILVGLRLAFYFLRNVMRITTYLYALWCLGEILLIVIFSTLYLFLMAGCRIPFFEVFNSNVLHFYSIMVYPYIIIPLAVMVIEPHISAMTDGVEDSALIRFYDENQKLKLVIATSAVLYIEAEENYVRVNYMDADKIKYYVLRNSMKRIEETATRHGLVRCQRSFYVNPSRIKVLRKDKDGMIFAQLDVIGAKQIPVSKKYYDNLSALL